MFGMEDWQVIGAAIAATCLVIGLLMPKGGGR